MVVLNFGLASPAEYFQKTSADFSSVLGTGVFCLSGTGMHFGLDPVPELDPDPT
jgi:hypothetical protein